MALTLSPAPADQTLLAPTTDLTPVSTDLPSSAQEAPPASSTSPVPSSATHSPESSTPAPDFTSIPASSAPIPSMADFGQQEKEQKFKWYMGALDQIDTAALKPDKYYQGKDLSYDPDQKNARLHATNDLFLTMANGGKPIPTDELNRRLLRLSAAHSYFGGRGADSEEEFNAEIVKGATKRKNRNEFQRELASAAYLSATLGKESYLQFYSNWISGKKNHPGYDHTLDADNIELSRNVIQQQTDRIAPFAGMLQGTWQEIQNGKTTFYSIYDKIAPEDQEAFVQTIGYLAKSLPKEEKATFLKSLAKQSGRDFANLGLGMLDALWDAPDDFKQGGLTADLSEERQASDAELRKEKDLITDIRNIAEGTYDPVKPSVGWLNDSIEKGIYSAPGAAFSTVSALVPYAGPVAMFGLAREEGYQTIRRNLIEAGKDPAVASDVAQTLSTYSAVPSMLLDRMGAHGIAGKLPGLNQVLTRLADHFGQNAMIRGGSRLLGGAAFETLTENGQDLLPHLVQEVASGLQKDIPGVKISGPGGVFDGYWARSLETFVATMPLAAFGMIKGQLNDSSLFKIQNASDLQLQALGITEQKLQDIRAAQGHASLAIAVDSAFKTLDPRSPAAKTAANSLLQEIREQRQLVGKGIAAGLYPNFFRSTDGTYDVIHPETGERIGTAADVDSATRIAKSFLTEKGAEFDNQVDYLTTLFESAEHAATLDPEANFSIELGNAMTQEKAALEDPANAARYIQQVELQERMNGGDGSYARTILGLSTSQLLQGARHTINRLFQGASATDVFHETFHGLRRDAHAAGRITRSDEIQLLHSLDTIMAQSKGRHGLGSLRFLPENFDSLSAKDQAVALDEGISRVAEMEILRRRKDENGGAIPVPGGIITRNITALAKMFPGAAQKFAPFLNAVRAQWGITLSQVVALKRAEREGRFDSQSYDAYLDKITGKTTGESSALTKDNTTSPKNTGEQISSWIDGDFSTSFSLDDRNTPASVKKQMKNATDAAIKAARNYSSDTLRNVGNIWLKLGEIPGTLRFPKEIKGTTIQEIAKSFQEIMPDLETSIIHETDNPDHMWSDPSNFKSGRVDVNIPQNAPEIGYEVSDPRGSAYIIEKGGYVWLNASGVGGYTDPRKRNKASIGAPAYQIAQTYARNNGYQFIPDPDGVSEIAHFRRWSQQLSSSIRMGDTSHQHATLDVNGWTGGKDAALDAGNLAIHEYEYVKHFFPEIEDLRLSPDLHSFQHDNGTRISPAALDDLFTGRRDPSLTGIGKSTLRRAIATRSATIAQEMVRSESPVAGTGEFGIYTRGIEDLFSDRGSIGKETSEGRHPLNQIAYSLAPIGAGPKPITEAPKPVSLSNPFPDHITQPSDLRKEFWKNFDTITKNWPKVIDTPEGPIAWSKAKTGNKLRVFKDGEPAALHYMAAAQLPELLKSSTLAAVENEGKGDRTVAEVHKRYAWADFPNGERRNILLTIDRMSDHADEKLQDADQAYSSEVLGVSLEVLPENKKAASSEFADSVSNHLTTTGDIAHETVNHKIGEGNDPSNQVRTSGRDSLTHFLSGIKPEHRHPNTNSEQSK